MKTFELEIITPSSTVFKGMVISLIVPGYEGYMGILAGHASFIGSLGNGKISFKKSETNRENAYLVSDGFIEVSSLPFTATEVTILAENISSGSQVLVKNPA
jgi:F-type H+-transporting ATPase subunit epsilon